MRVFDFDHAIVREPGRSVVNGLREDALAEPSYSGVLKEHAAYVAALRAAGLTVDVLPPLEAYPDSVFVEDPALVFPQGAILLRPGAPSRLGERDDMRVALGRHFRRVLELDGDDEFADGGDVLVTPTAIFIGLSARTNESGAYALAAHLADFGWSALIANTPKGIPHFKSAVSVIDEETVLATKAIAESRLFSMLPRNGHFGHFNVLVTPDREEAAANSLRVNDVVLVGDCFPRTIDLLTRGGYTVVSLPIGEIGKLDAGLSCMSLRWRKAA